jgi:hypothetical protein
MLQSFLHQQRWICKLVRVHSAYAASHSNQQAGWGMSFVSTDPACHQSENIWFTPPEIVNPLGKFYMDVCTVSYRPFDIAYHNACHDLGVDSLSIDWTGGVWMNPPYGKEIVPFIEKFKCHNNGIALVFARM